MIELRYGLGATSSRRASSNATAGIMGRTERPLTVQFRKAAKRKVPSTQARSSTESESFFRQKSATASDKAEAPPTRKSASSTASSVWCCSGKGISVGIQENATAAAPIIDRP